MLPLSRAEPVEYMLFNLVNIFLKGRDALLL